MPITDTLTRWQDLAKFAASLLALDDEVERRALVSQAARNLLGMERACLVAIGRPMSELLAPGRNQLPFFEYLALQRRPVFVQDAHGDHGFEMPVEIADWRFPSLLFIPLIDQDVALGVLALASAEVREFSAEEEAMIGAFVPQVAVALASLTLRESARRLDAHQQFLSELDEMLPKPNLPEVMSQTVKLLKKVLDVERVLIFTRQDKRNSAAFEVSVAEGCPYASSGILCEHACGKLINSQGAVRGVEIRNAEAIAALAGFDHMACNERQMAFAPIQTHRQHYGSIVMLNKATGADFTQTELDLLEKVSRKLGLAYDNHAMFEQLQAGSLETIKGLVRAVDSKDKYTANHSDNVAQYGYLTAVAMGLDPEKCQRLRLAGILHDIGKIGIPDAILNKPGKLTDEEFTIIKSHPGKGYRILEPFRDLRDVADAACSHHERWDGRGYPRKLAGEQIPLGGRILALADAFDTMSSDRKYRARIPIMDCLLEMRRCSGSHFDPSVVSAFFQAMAVMGEVDLNNNLLPPADMLWAFADLDRPLESIVPTETSA